MDGREELNQEDGDKSLILEKKDRVIKFLKDYVTRTK